MDVSWLENPVSCPDLPIAVGQFKGAIDGWSGAADKRIMQAILFTDEGCHGTLCQSPGSTAR